VHELVTGERPFRGATAGSILRATLDQTPALAGEAWAAVPSLLRDATARMLARDPADRFADASEVLATLRRLAPSRPTLPIATAQAIATAPTQRARPARRRSAVALAFEGSALIASVALLAVPGPRRRTLAAAPPGMVRIDAGALEVGRDVAEIDRECAAIGPACDRKQMMREVPRERVTVAPFYLDVDEVTNAAYADMLNTYRGTLAVVDDEDYHYPRFVRRNAGIGHEGAVLIDLNAKHGGIDFGDRKQYVPRPGHAELPAAQVSWYGAALYCESIGKRLPTDDEWEAAARGADDRRYPWGDDPLRCGAVAVAADGEIEMPHDCPAIADARAVGTSPQDLTPDGVRDLAGNVAEWTSSTFVEGDRRLHPADAAPETPRVIRGGSWGESLGARTSGRNRRPPSVMGANLGFRCAMSAPDE
jgi:formylglycine-generating enzyme required for sulfatase activity